MIKALIDNRIKKGYQLLEKGNVAGACDTWLKAWSDIHKLLERDMYQSFTELEYSYSWTQFLYNFVQDLEMQLHNAGIIESIYFEKRIAFAKEAIVKMDKEEELLIGNLKMAIADSHYYLGKPEEGNQLYRQYLKEDPSWGWGYIYWADQQSSFSEDNNKGLEQAKSIIQLGLSQTKLREREDFLERALEILQDSADKEFLEKLGREQGKLEAKKLFKQDNIKSQKVGRNQPCPCGSGGKYKHCCGR